MADFEDRKLVYAAGADPNLLANKGQSDAKQTEREIDAIIAECNRRLPREAAIATTALYARYSTKHQQSLADQVRALCEVAVRELLYVPRDLVFTDAAMSGRRSRRCGFSALDAALRTGMTKTLLVFGTNRLFRKAYRAIQFVEEATVELGVRFFFVQQNIDTDKKGWRLNYQIQSAVDENGASAYADNIRAAHLGMFEHGLVVGTLPPGFCRREVHGQRNRRGNARCAVVVDQAAAAFIVRIYTWFLDGVKIDEIARRLNMDPDSPRPRSSDRTWSHTSVKAVLANERYRGHWAYGKKESVYQPSKDYVKQVAREQPLREFHIEELRIVSDELWYGVQSRFQSPSGNAGRRPAAGGDKPPQPKALNGLLRCPTHNCSLRVGGSRGHMMHCPACNRLHAGDRPLYSHLNRQLAFQLVVQRLSELIRGDDGLSKAIVQELTAIAAAQGQPDPSQLESLRRRVERLAAKIQSNLRNCGDTEEDQKENDAVVRELRAQRTQLQKEIAQIEGASMRLVNVPSEQEVRELLADFEGILRADSISGDAQAQTRVREVVKLLTGGRIELAQMGERKAQRGWLQGRFKTNILARIVETMNGDISASCGTECEVVIDFVRPNSRDEDAAAAWRLYKAGKLVKEIAKELAIGKPQVLTLLRYAAEKCGEVYVDGRTRRSQLSKKNVKPSLFQEIADEVVQLFHSGMLLGEIAQQLKIDRNTVTKSIVWWHVSRELPVPNTRVQRKVAPIQMDDRKSA